MVMLNTKLIVSRTTTLLQISCLVIFLVTFLAYQVFAMDLQAEKAIEKFLTSQQTDTENAVSQGITIADLNHDGREELVLVWTLLGPTYWQNNLTVFVKTKKGYKQNASIPLIGEAKLSTVEKGVISVDQVVYAKDDPKCCPSIEKQVKYCWNGKKIKVCANNKE